MGNVNRRLIPVAMPCYGGPPNVGGTAARMQRQRYPGFGLVILNHGSKNESATIIAYLFHRSFHKTGWHAHGTKYSLASFLRAPAFKLLPRLIEDWRSARKPI